MTVNYTVDVFPVNKICRWYAVTPREIKCDELGWQQRHFTREIKMLYILSH